MREKKNLYKKLKKIKKIVLVLIKIFRKMKIMKTKFFKMLNYKKLIKTNK